MSERTFYGRFRLCSKAAGFAPMGINVLRPTAATIRRVADEAIEAVSAFLTHSPLAEQRR
jgi:hypothetical protein